MVASVGEEKIIAQNELKNHQYSSAHFPLCSIDGCWIFRAFPRMFAPYPETQFSLGFGGRPLPTDFSAKTSLSSRTTSFSQQTCILCCFFDDIDLRKHSGFFLVSYNGSNTLSPRVSFLSVLQTFIFQALSVIFHDGKLSGFSNSLLHYYSFAGGPRALLSLTRAKREKWSWKRKFVIVSLLTALANRKAINPSHRRSNRLSSSRILWHFQW